MMFNPFHLNYLFCTKSVLNCNRTIFEKSLYGYIFNTHIIQNRQNSNQFKYKPEVEFAVNRQIQAEQQAAQNYLSMAVVFLHVSESRPGCGGHFMSMYHEEISHMHKFIAYQLLRGGIPVIGSLKEPNVNKKLTLLDAYKQALEMEKTITELLENLICIAESVKDHQSTDFVVSQFMAEQFQSINDMAHHVSKLTKLDGNEHAIYQYDLELAKLYPYKYSWK